MIDLIFTDIIAKTINDPVHKIVLVNTYVDSIGSDESALPRILTKAIAVWGVIKVSGQNPGIWYY